MDTCLPKVYMLYNLCQGLSSCVYQSLSDIDHFCSSSDSSDTGVLTTRVRLHSVRESEEIPIKSLPARWPGVESLMALLAREKDDDSPNLRLLLAEFFIAITMSLFSYAFTIYDSKWIFRLCAHEMNENAYATVFGGAGEKKLRSSVPVRPPPPSRPSATILNDSSIQTDDSAAIRAKLHAKVFGVENNAKPQSRAVPVSTQGASEQIISCWVPPKKHIVQFYAEKVETQSNYDSNDYFYDSDEDSCDGDSYTGSLDEDGEEREPRPHDSPQSYAWLLLRLVSVIHMQHRIKEFLALAGFDLIESKLEAYPDGCPDNFLRNSFIEGTPGTVQAAPLLRKYRSLIEPGNTPFEYEEKGVGPVKRLWCFLVKQEHLSAHFIKFIFGKTGTVDSKDQSSMTTMSTTLSGFAVSDSIKIIQREHEPIIAFACNSARPGCIVVSTGREIQEISLEKVFEEKELSSAKHSTSSFLNNRVELDVAIHSLQRDTLRDNDDYQLITEGKGRVQGSSYINSFIIDRSRVALKKLRKRPISGIRRLDSHSTMPYYVSGSSDGSILLWEWGVDQPLFTARSAGQYAKVSKLAFAQNGNKFAACMAVRKPFFSQRCHTKSAADVKFLGQTSSILVTAGHSAGDQNVVLWDTLMPQAKCMIHSFVGHQEGATCCVYMANTQSILSGGRHGDICIWDVRQRQLRSMLKAFDTGSVKCLAVDANCDVLVAGSGEGDIKVWTADLAPQLLHTLPGEHVSRGGFSLRQLPSSSLQGVQQSEGCKKWCRSQGKNSSLSVAWPDDKDHQ
uniref:Uncharacterized protein n=1 Tax=Ditylenchus dipsaci TaxID=166011 RepID=A0A915ED72_9BILA